MKIGVTDLEISETKAMLGRLVDPSYSCELFAKVHNVQEQLASHKLGWRWSEWRPSLCNNFLFQHHLPSLGILQKNTTEEKADAERGSRALGRKNKQLDFKNVSKALGSENWNKLESVVRSDDSTGK